MLKNVKESFLKTDPHIQHTLDKTLTHLAKPWMQPARSLVITPFSTVFTQTFSNVWENLDSNNAEWQIMMWNYINICHMSKTITEQSDDTLYQVGISVQFASVLQPSGPSKDASNGVSTGRSSLQSKDTVKVTYWNFNMLHFVQIRCYCLWRH